MKSNKILTILFKMDAKTCKLARNHSKAAETFKNLWNELKPTNM